MIHGAQPAAKVGVPDAHGYPRARSSPEEGAIRRKAGKRGSDTTESDAPEWEPPKGPLHTPFASLAPLRATLAAGEKERAAAAAEKARHDARLQAEDKARRDTARSAGVISEDPVRLFEQAMAGARPLQQDRRGRVGATANKPDPEIVKRRRGEDAEVAAQLADLVGGAGTFDVTETDEHVEGLGPGVDRRLLVQLRRGDFAVQAHLDLHGLTRDEAHERVESFFAEARTRGLRCVLVIHGRGLGSPDGVPVLKEQLRGWLERGRIGRGVLAFSTAQRHDGGAGAMYVLLRR